ncbi:DUF1800 domain-containing protein [Mucilaginibacter sp.]
MIKGLRYSVAILLLLGGFMLLSSFFNEAWYKAVKFPYKKQGLTERQAVAHLLSRFTYGATPGQVDEVVHEGLENWFQQQLDAGLADDSLNQVLSQYDALKLSNSQIAETYPKQGQLVRMAVKDGFINKDSVKSAGRKAYRDTLQVYMQQKGYKPEQELFRQFINQKVLRAAYTHNQLQEVMADFWFNHFNVSITKNDCAQFIPDYERDVIRPNALGKFGNLLLATAKAPAMLYYLDNFTSSAPGSRTPVMNALMRSNHMAVMQGDSIVTATIAKAKKARAGQGLNENYAREVMELHTLGVDGGYSQQDVTQAARVLTGWSIAPMGTYGNGAQVFLNRFTPEQLQQKGFVHEGDFFFNINRHDKGEKVVLGHHFTSNGYQEGVDLLNLLAHQQATAQFISRKLAVRFVSDNPPKALVDKMTRAFQENDGDIKAVLVTMVSAPEFWSSNALREKTKSPFELTIGAVRSLNATINQPYQLYNWVAKMGEKKYYYQAPTGFPDKGQYWINTGSLLTRMNFGLALASGRIPGVKIDLAALNQHHEPESAQQALMIYSKLMMPERNLESTIQRLTPLLNDPELAGKVSAANAQTPAPAAAMQPAAGAEVKPALGKGNQKNFIAMQNASGNNSMLSQVVGVIIGSPEYQRR